jgi:twitching motility protein PilT
MLPEKVRNLLEKAKASKATDIHICAGNPVLFRIGRDLVPVTEEKFTSETSKRLSYKLLTEEQILQFEEQKDYDLMLADENGRYRVNISYNDGHVGAVIRLLPEEPKSIADLHLPLVVKDLARRSKGLVLITGSTSQGKTTTMTAMIEEINRNYRKHIVTIEDPIEYVCVDKKSVVRQRELGRDTKEFSSGLRAALRQDPDVIGIGEMRDYDTVRIALTAAETGVLVISTLHIISIDKIIERLLSYAPPERENHIRYLLADSLQGIIHQELLPTREGGKRVACEVLVVTDAARNIIRSRGTYFLRNVLTTGARYGMMTMKQSVDRLVEENVVSEDVAKSVLVNYGG